MGITNITWEEYETFKKVETPDNLHIREHNGHYYTFFELGIASVRRVFEVQIADFNEYLTGKRSARELRYKSQNDEWPSTEEERRASEKNFIKKHPTSLIDFPQNRLLFTQEELEKLIPIAEKLRIESEGKLPDDYVSPLDND